MGIIREMETSWESEKGESILVSLSRLPLVSIIILNYNGRQFLESCLKSVLQSNYPNFEIILVDNASTDNSIMFVKRVFKGNPRLEIIKNPKNLGFAEGNNVGARHAKGKYVILLNNDTIVEPTWLRELVIVMEKHPEVGAAQGKLLLLGNKKVIDSVGDIVDYYGSSIRIGGDWREEDRGQYDYLREIFSARGAAIIIRKKIIDTIGLFDPEFFMSYEDIDLSWRIRLRGYKILFVPKSVIYHVSGGSSPPSFIKKFHNEKNRIVTSVKNQALSFLFRYNPLIPTLGFMIGDLIVRKNPLLLGATLKAIVWVLRNLREIWKKRIHTQESLRGVPHSEVTKYMLKTNFKKLVSLFLMRMIKGERKAAKHYFKASQI
ncbi:MAG: glycosyltransferase family 2 protein [Promethearchaeota archaeon]